MSTPPAKRPPGNFAASVPALQGWPIHGAMIFQAYGPGQPAHAFMPAALRAASAGEDFPLTEGSQIRDWIHGEDVAAGVVGMVERQLAPGTTVELGTGSGTSLAEVAHLIYQTINRGTAAARLAAQPPWRGAQSNRRRRPHRGAHWLAGGHPVGRGYSSTGERVVANCRQGITLPGPVPAVPKPAKTRRTGRLLDEIQVGGNSRFHHRRRRQSSWGRGRSGGWLGQNRPLSSAHSPGAACSHPRQPH
ncbi:MAG: NAD-dependent epimerase/dehydratase family protein [Chloroflexi bacterium]|nr:NAD-dependent epimerase/dehydratase family protein [Chloroflexota bacterium]